MSTHEVIRNGSPATPVTTHRHQGTVVSTQPILGHTLAGFPPGNLRRTPRHRDSLR